MFRKIESGAVDRLTIIFEGIEMKVARGQTLAAALLEAGVGPFRTSVVTGEPRAPYCLMGICFECLLTVDGAQNRQSCLIEVCDGMTVSRQDRARDIGVDIRP